MEKEFKPCIVCKVSKMRTDFHKNLNADGLFNVCKKCHYIRYTEHRKDPKNKEKWRRYRQNGVFKRRYGITLEQYEKMVTDQENKCLICKKEPDNYGPKQNHVLSVDHCHKTGKIRGLLCHRCNTALGAFHESPEIIIKALEYIKNHF